MLELAVILELTNTGFAILRLSRLATRASWSGRRDSNSRDEFGRLACFRLHHFRGRGAGFFRVRPPTPWSWGENYLPQINTNWSGRTELNCHHECPRLGCERYTTPRQPFTQTTCLISATTSTKSSWFFITASIDL